jgi:hypothetical protein
VIITKHQSGGKGMDKGLGFIIFAQWALMCLAVMLTLVLKEHTILNLPQLIFSLLMGSYLTIFMVLLTYGLANKIKKILHEQ